MELEAVRKDLDVPAAHPRGRYLSARAEPADRQSRVGRSGRLWAGRRSRSCRSRRAAARAVVPSAREERRGECRARAGRGAAALAEGAVRQALRGEEDQDHRGRRSRARRAQDGEGLLGREAPRAAGRQDGRPARQQGRDLDDRSGRGHAVHGRRHARRHRAEPARRALAHERRPGARDALGLGREGLGTEDRRNDPQRQPR